MIVMAIFFLFLLIGLAVLLFTAYTIIMWRVNRKTRKRPTDAKIKWQRRIDALRDVKRE